MSELKFGGFSIICSEKVVRCTDAGKYTAVEI